MRSELIGEDRGELIGVRILKTTPEAKEVEYSFKSTGNLFGVEFQDLGTYVSMITPDGTERGEGHGFITTKEGEMLSYKVSGLSPSSEKGFESKFKGVAFYETNNPKGKLAKLCKSPILVMYDSDEKGNSHTTYYEWIE